MSKTVIENLAEINEKISVAAKKSGRSLEDVKLIAVTKYVTDQRAVEARDSGISSFGENYEDGFLTKSELLGVDAEMHFIGSLQSKKVKNVINRVDFLHSLDRESLAKEIQKRADFPVKCLIQVNVSEEASKHGINAKDLKKFVQNMLKYDKIEIIGLMTMAPLTTDNELVRSCFSSLRELRDEIRSLNLPNISCEHLSMGMSNDFEIAIEEGATMIRVGTALVG